MIFKEYKHILGKPKRGVHRQRILDAAAFDYLGTIFLSLLFSYFTKIPLVLSTILMFIFGELCHYLFGLQTNTLKYIGFKI